MGAMHSDRVLVRPVIVLSAGLIRISTASVHTFGCAYKALTCLFLPVMAFDDILTCVFLFAFTACIHRANGGAPGPVFLESRE
jgi:hypothetical protein